MRMRLRLLSAMAPRPYIAATPRRHLFHYSMRGSVPGCAAVQPSCVAIQGRSWSCAAWCRVNSGACFAR